MKLLHPFHKLSFSNYSTIIVGIIIALMLSGSINAQNSFNNPRFNHISVQEGLSQSTVFCIAQDHKQFMWFGTRSGGLNRYDGCTFKVFKHNPNDSTTISNNEVISILVDHEGKLWLGTRKGGLNRFEEKTETFLRYPIKKGLNSTSGNTINTLFQDSKQRIWVGSNSGLDQIIDHKVIKNPITALGNKNISAVNEDSSGTIYITDKEGLYVYKESTQDLKHYPFPFTDEEISNRNFSGHLYIDHKQQLWLGTSNGLLTFVNESLIFPLDSHNNPELHTETRSITEDQQGNLWFGTLKGLFRYHPEDDQLELYTQNDNNLQSLSHNSVYSLYKDNTGIVWIGTWGGGVNMLSSKLYKFQHYKHQSNNEKTLSNNSVSSFLVDQNGLWVGTESGGLNFRPLNSYDFKIIDHPILKGSEHIKTLLKSESQRIYIGSFNGGLCTYQPHTHQAEHIINNEKVFALAEHPKGTIWAGTINGLFCYNEKTKSLKHYTHTNKDPYSISHNFINVLFTSSDNTLWIGTKEGGLMRYSADKDQFISYKHQTHDSTSLLSDYIINIEEDNNGKLLVGTSNGINIFNPDRQNFEILDIVSLPDKNINGLICDRDNNYWIATNKGITKYTHDNTPVNYDMNDGLQSNEFNRNACYQDQEGNIYFGGINGFNVFQPEQVPINTVVPEIKIINFKLSNQDITPLSKNSPLTKHITETKNITLDHDQNDLSFGFVALNYIVPQKNQYAYKLIGYNNDWIYCGNQRIANYTNLKPGNYTFIVKGSNNDNIWNDKGCSIDIVINQPFWKTPLAYSIYLLTLTLLFFLLRWLITMRLEQQNLLKMERVEKKRIKELNQMKLRFFTNVAHEFRTPLTLIVGPLQEIKQHLIHNNEQTYLMNVAQNNVKRLLHLVDELLDFRKADQHKIQLHITENSLIDILKNIISCFSESVKHKNINLEFLHPLEETPQYFDQDVMDKVIFNLLSNALKYTPKDGKITIALEIIKNKAIINVIDSGEGISENNIEKIFDRFYQGDCHSTMVRGSGIGLAYAKRLVEIHQGEIKVSSTLNKGATFTVIIPVNKKAYKRTQSIDKTTHIQEFNFEDAEEIKTPQQHQNTSTSSDILIVEDNKELNAYLAYYFRAYHVHIAYDGQEGLEIASRVVPDIIISDIMMPNMNGLEMCKKLKNQFLTSHIPLILLTAKSEKEQKIEGLKHGADAYIEKPFDTQLLEISVKNLLRQQEKLKARLANTKDQEHSTSSLNKHDQRFIKIVNKTIQEELHNASFSLEDLSGKLGMSRSQLFRKFKALYPYSPNETLRIERLNYAKQLITERNYNINEISELAGFSSTSYFTTSFKKYFGITPTEHAKQSAQ